MALTTTTAETATSPGTAADGTSETDSRSSAGILTPEEWREYFRRNYLRCLRQAEVRVSAGWVESEAETWVLSAHDMLVHASIDTRKVTRNADL